MKRITNYETKEIECDKCGRVSKVAKFIPLRFSKCPECGSLKIRLYKPRGEPKKTTTPPPTTPEP